jgi:hypothetical protein
MDAVMLLKPCRRVGRPFGEGVESSPLTPTQLFRQRRRVRRRQDANRPRVRTTRCGEPVGSDGIGRNEEYVVDSFPRVRRLVRVEMGAVPELIPILVCLVILAILETDKVHVERRQRGISSGWQMPSWLASIHKRRESNTASRESIIPSPLPPFFGSS